MNRGRSRATPSEINFLWADLCSRQRGLVGETPFLDLLGWIEYPRGGERRRD
jgi:hypothetical protein